MGLGGRKRRRREQVAAEVHAALAEFAAAVEVRLHAEVDRSRQTQLALIDALRSLRKDFEGRDAELTRALEGLGTVVTQAAAAIEAAQTDRRALADALARLAPQLGAGAAPAPPGERVIGGTVHGGAAEVEIAPRTDDIEIVPGDAPAASRGRAVQCRFGDRWVDGFEVADVIEHGEHVRYRVRRVGDGTTLPQSFADDEVRPARTAPSSPEAGRSRTEWG